MPKPRLIFQGRFTKTHSPAVTRRFRRTSKQSVEQRDVFDATRVHAMQEERKSERAAGDLVGEGRRVDVNVAYGFQGTRQLLVANICLGEFDS